jgi:microcystin-dependent protein
MADPFIGMVQAFGFQFAPLDWAYCAGQILSIMDYQALYALIGCSFGGDCRNTMAMPDLRGRVNMGQGRMPGGQYYYDYAELGGLEGYHVPISHMATHAHGAHFTSSGGSSGSVQVLAGDGNQATPQTGYYLANAGGLIDQAKSFTDTPGSTVSLGGVSGGGSGGGSVTLNDAGTGTDALGNMMPSLTVNWCIALDGVFPARN